MGEAILKYWPEANEEAIRDPEANLDALKAMAKQLHIKELKLTAFGGRVSTFAKSSKQPRKRNLSNLRLLQNIRGKYRRLRAVTTITHSLPTASSFL